MKSKMMLYFTVIPHRFGWKPRLSFRASAQTLHRTSTHEVLELTFSLSPPPSTIYWSLSHIYPPAHYTALRIVTCQPLMTAMAMMAQLLVQREFVAHWWTCRTCKSSGYVFHKSVQQKPSSNTTPNIKHKWSQKTSGPWLGVNLHRNMKESDRKGDFYRTMLESDKKGDFVVWSLIGHFTGIGVLTPDAWGACIHQVVHSVKKAGHIFSLQFFLGILCMVHVHYVSSACRI